MTRREFSLTALRAAALSTVGVLPACGRRTWALLPPRPVTWTMKPLSSARVTETLLDDGRLRIRIEHDVLRGVTPAMLVWWWRNLDGEMRLGERTYARYLVWHPIDHIHFDVVERSANGGLGPGSRFHIVEALGADLKNLVDVVVRMRRLDEEGVAADVRMLGSAVMEFRVRLVPEPAGTRFLAETTIGFASWLRRLGANRLVLGRFFPETLRRVWIKHNVEEIGNLEFILPGLYSRA